MMWEPVLAAAPAPEPEPESEAQPAPELAQATPAPAPTPVVTLVEPAPDDRDRRISALKAATEALEAENQSLRQRLHDAERLIEFLNQ
jgi:hypothetical protein